MKAFSLSNLTPLVLAAVSAVVVAALLPASSAQAQTVIAVTRADCAALVAHRADADVTYKPGVDVHGNKVAPADLGGRPDIALPETVEIPITIELAPRFGLPATADLYKGEAEIGTAKVRVKDGRAWFNGQPLSSDAEHELARLCQERGVGSD